jgi:hypothetical protein
MDDCFMAVRRLKEGPPNMSDIMCSDELYSDSTFSDENSIFYSSMKPPYDNEVLSSLDLQLKNKKFYFKPYTNTNRSSDIFVNEISPYDITNGSIISSYFVSSAAAVA